MAEDQCANCGSDMPGDLRVCPACGTPVPPAADASAILRLPYYLYLPGTLSALMWSSLGLILAGFGILGWRILVSPQLSNAPPQLAAFGDFFTPLGFTLLQLWAILVLVPTWHTIHWRTLIAFAAFFAGFLIMVNSGAGGKILYPLPFALGMLLALAGVGIGTVLIARTVADLKKKIFALAVAAAGLVMVFAILTPDAHNRIFLLLLALALGEIGLLGAAVHTQNEYRAMRSG